MACMLSPWVPFRPCLATSEVSPRHGASCGLALAKHRNHFMLILPSLIFLMEVHLKESTHPLRRKIIGANLPQNNLAAQNNQELLSMYSAIVSMCAYVPFKNIKNAVPKFMYWYIPSIYRYIPLYVPEVCTGFILFVSSMFQKTYI